MAAKIVHKNFVYLEKQGVVFGYVPKVACTNWKIALRRLQGFANYQDVEIAHDRERSGLRFLDPLDSKDIKILESPRIKKIAFVRNPYSRVLSAYLNKIDRFNKGSESPTEGNYWFTVYENIAAFSKSQTSHRSLAKLLQKTLKVNRKRDNSANVDFFTFLTWLKYPHTPAHLSEEADDAFSQGVVVTVTDAADRGVDAGVSEPLGVSDRQVLAAAIAVMDQLVSLGRRSLADGLVQCIQDETSRHRGRDTPANDLAGENVDDEGHVDHALPA